jgi:hypothetical protein
MMIRKVFGRKRPWFKRKVVYCFRSIKIIIINRHKITPPKLWIWAHLVLFHSRQLEKLETKFSLLFIRTMRVTGVAWLLGLFLQLGRPGFESRWGKIFFLLPQNIQNACGVHTAYCSVGTWVLSRGISSRVLNLTTHFHVVPSLRADGAVRPFLLCFFVVWTAKTAPFILHKLKNKLVLRTCLCKLG